MLMVFAHTLALAHTCATAMTGTLMPQAPLHVLPSTIARQITAVVLKNAHTLALARILARAILATPFPDHHAMLSTNALQTMVAAPKCA